MNARVRTCAAILAGAVAIGATPEATGADQVSHLLSRAREALGGAAVPDGVQTVVLRGSTTEGSGHTQAHGEFEISAVLPDKYVRVERRTKSSPPSGGGNLHPAFYSDLYVAGLNGAQPIYRVPLLTAETDLRRGLDVIGTRAESLNRFMAQYARLARLPAPTPGDVVVADWVKRVVELEAGKPISVVAGPDVVITGDGDQLDQALINLVKNALEAVGGRGAVEVGWRLLDSGMVEVWVRDDGPGIPSSTNLFVPFFTTKPGGTGIGLALSRQITEAHGGTLVLTNRGDAPGALARVRLPVRREP